MSTQIGTITGVCRLMMNDTVSTSYRWTDATLIQHGNDIIVEIIKAFDEAYVVRAPAQLTPNTVLQQSALPSDGSLVKLLSITRNLTPNTTTPGGYLPGKSITKVASVEVMDKSRKGWYAARPATEIENWLPAGPDYNDFFCYPPPSPQVPVWVETLFTAIPPQMAALTDLIPVKDKFRYQIQLGITGRALMQDLDAADQPRGKAYMDLFYATLK